MVKLNNESKYQAKGLLQKLQNIAAKQGNTIKNAYSYEELLEHSSKEQNKWVTERQSDHMQKLINNTAQESDVQVQGKTFHNFLVEHAWQNSLLQQVTSFAMQTTDGDKNIVLAGEYGSGKSHLLASVLNFLSEGHCDGVRHTVLGKQWESIVDSLWSKDEKFRRKIRKLIERVDVLFIDEVGANEVAPMHQQLKELGRLIRIRGNQGKVTLMATNFDVESVPTILGEFTMGGLQEHGLQLIGINAEFNSTFNQRKPISKVII